MDHEPGWITLSEEERRLIGFWAADCAESVNPLPAADQLKVRLIKVVIKN